MIMSSFRTVSARFQGPAVNWAHFFEIRFDTHLALRISRFPLASLTVLIFWKF